MLSSLIKLIVIKEPEWQWIVENILSLVYHVYEE